MNKIEEIFKSWGIMFNPNDLQSELAGKRMEICDECDSKRTSPLIHCGECGCALKAKVYSGDDQKIAGDDRDFARSIYDLAKQVGVEIPGATPREDSEQEPPSKVSERFKPSSLFKNENLDKLDLEITDTGVIIEGTELNIVSDADITTAEDNWIERARQFKSSRGEEFTPEYEQNVRRYVRGIYAKANHNIRYMRKLAESGEELGTYEFRGEEGKDVIVKNLTTAITQYVGNQQQLTPILSALQKMKSTKGVREFNSAYEEFSTALQGTAIESSKKYIIICLYLFSYYSC